MLLISAISGIPILIVRPENFSGHATRIAVGQVSLWISPQEASIM
jgi:hypothetical protein